MGHDVGVTATQTLPSLDGRTFQMVSSTTSAVNPQSPSVFRYFEQDGVIWGDYTGGTVSIGHFVGTRTGDSIGVSFVHVLAATGEVVTGSGESDIERGDAGRLRLVEHYEMHGAAQLSVCVETVAA